MISTPPFETERLLLRPPLPEDALTIFERYAGDPDVTRYLGWPHHRAIEDTRAFIAFSETEWARRPTGPLLVFSRATGNLLGSSGLWLETSTCAQTGYVFAQDAWGLGYATETLNVMVALAVELGITRVYAICHTDHRASWHVMEKCRFTREGILRRYMVFPNLGPHPLDVYRYVRLLA